MYLLPKLKPDRSITGLLPAFFILAVSAVLWALFGPTTAARGMSALVLLYFAYSFTSWIRTRSAGYLAAAGYQISLGLYLLTLPPDWRSASASTLNRLFLVALIALGIVVVYYTVTKRLKWRGREVFELAAAPVEDVGNGYTARPLHKGKVQYTRYELLAFSEFLRRRLIALPYREGDRILLVLVKMGEEFRYLLGRRDQILDDTWVAFDFEGNVSVNISQRDYLEFREALSFDQLCESLGELFIEFLETFKRGEAVRIIARMDALGLSPFS